MPLKSQMRGKMLMKSPLRDKKEIMKMVMKSQLREKKKIMKMVMKRRRMLMSPILLK